jgi:spore coat polysaccharide biosynthesis protein SpsF
MTGKIVAIVQARMSSSRLPGKVLLEIQGRPMLARVVDRVARARAVDDILVATTTEPTDDIIEEFCVSYNLQCSRGSQFDVLDRYYQAARVAQADVIVRITADCPVIDPALVDDAVRTLIGDEAAEGQASSISVPKDLSFVANRLPPPWQRTYPIGLDTEVCTFEALDGAWRGATEPQQREHVMPYLYEGVTLMAVRPGLSFGVTPRGFRVALLDCELDLGAYRWTVDTAEDLEFVCRVYEHFEGRDDFSWKDILELVNDQPELMRINAGVRHKSLGDIDERAPGLDGR